MSRLLRSQKTHRQCMLCGSLRRISEDQCCLGMLSSGLMSHRSRSRLLKLPFLRASLRPSGTTALLRSPHWELGCCVEPATLPTALSFAAQQVVGPLRCSTRYGGSRLERSTAFESFPSTRPALVPQDTQYRYANATSTRVNHNLWPARYQSFPLT